MSFAPTIPNNAPFTDAQRAWLNGFFAGLFSRGPAQAEAAAPAPLAKLSIVFASQTGTAERLAKKASKSAGKSGFAPTLLDAGQLTLEKLQQETDLLFITSTYGDGEAPDSAKSLLNALKAATGTPLSKLRYSICALGDSNYARFCQAGKDFEAFFNKLGATALSPRVDCDLGQEDKYGAWLDASLKAFNATPGGPGGASTESADAEEEDDGHKIHAAPVLEVRRLNAPDSGKEVNHVAFCLRDSGLSYEAGDALSLKALNAPELVAEILALLGAKPSDLVTVDKKELSLEAALTEHFDLGKPPADLLALLGIDTSGGNTPHHVVDALAASQQPRPTPAAFVAKLRRLQPRLYSISSSPKAHAGQVHLTVGAVRYEHAGRKRKGVASTFLAERALAQGKVQVAVHKNNGFRLPSAGETPVIMIGPGTGIAPFRSFIHERLATGASGPNWLFFGDQKAASDFLYKDELTALETAGKLRLSLAWSRDQTAKVYVQTRMLEQAEELYSWLEKGAHVYVCGDASRMAKDVDAALHEVLIKAAGKSPAEAAAYVENLKGTRRYQRDVY